MTTTKATAMVVDDGASRAFPVAYEDSSSERGTRRLPEAAIREDNTEDEKAKPSFSPRASVTAVEESSPGEDEQQDVHANHRVIFKESMAVVIHEESMSDSGNFVSFERVQQGEEEDTVVDEIPGPSTFCNNSRQKRIAASEDLDLSSTERHRKGGGILASQTELSMNPQEFAAGCNLLQASARGDRVAMEILLKRYPDHVNFRDYDRRTALHVAASEGHVDICRYLVEEKGARINRSDRWGGSPLDDAHRHRQQDVVKFLRQHGATTGSLDQTTNLITAAADGDVEEVRALLSFTSTQQINAGDYDHRTSLHLAAGEGRLEIVKLLCQAGANVNVQDRWGGRPLDDALRNRQDEVVEYLQCKGAMSGEPHAKDDEESRGRPEEDDNMKIEFGELEMVERIGAGAFGEIYKCRWRGTLVAAKCIKSARIRREWLANHAMQNIKNGGNGDDMVRLMDEAKDDSDLNSIQQDEALADFRQEISVLRNLRHPHIVLLLAYSTTANYEVMISELMKCSLLDIFKAHIIQGTRMPKKTQIVYAQQLAKGMNYLHTCKPPVIHRDLKPANLLIDHSGVLKISDFGLAKVRPDPKSMEADQFVMTGETGSYRFMAPEVYRHEGYTEMVDVYSYAMILYYLLSGRPPWSTMNGLMAVEKAANYGDRPNIPRYWDERLSRLLQQCWDENPQARPSFDKILQVLDNYSHEVFMTDSNTLEQIGGPPSEAVKSQCCIIL